MPPGLTGQVRPGTVVRVPLHGRRVRGWVVAITDRPDTDRALQSIDRVSGWGPSEDLVALAPWAAWRWAGRRTTFFRTASPPTAVRSLPQPRHAPSSSDVESSRAAGTMVDDALTAATSIVRVPPAGDTFPLVAAAAARGDALVLAPSHSAAAFVGARLRRAGFPVAVLPGQWAQAAAGGCTAVGARAAAWAPRPRLGAVVVLDEHDEAYQEERAPTWNARDVAVERAARAGVPAVLASPCPSLETLASATLVVAPRADEREGWPVVEVVDRRDEPPGAGLYSTRLVDLVRAAQRDRRVVCVLNRKGRARLLVCASCGELGRCEMCQSAVEQADSGLACRRCGTVRPSICLRCGGEGFKALRPGITRVREELELLANQPVAEVSADVAPGPPPDTAIVVGTEAVLHRLAGAHVVAFLDFDQELLAPRYRAAEQALALLARGARLTGGRAGGGRLVVQTRLPGHEAIDAAVHADPSRLAVVEGARRAALGFPPERALALVSGAAAPAFVDALTTEPSLDIIGPSDGRWLVRAADHKTLCDALTAVSRPPGRLRVAVDPLRA